MGKPVAAALLLAVLGLLLASCDRGGSDVVGVASDANYYVGLACVIATPVDTDERDMMDPERWLDAFGLEVSAQFDDTGEQLQRLIDEADDLFVESALTSMSHELQSAESGLNIMWEAIRIGDWDQYVVGVAKVHEGCRGAEMTGYVLSTRDL